MKDLKKALSQLQQQGLYRRRRCLQGPQGREIILDGHRLLNFSSNDYLGLANHPDVVRSFKQAADQYGVGSGSAHLVNGHSRPHQQLEDALAEFTGYPRALLFSTGYMANLAVAQSLCSQGDYIIEDRLNHASLLDAAKLSGGKLMRHLHLDYQSLEKKLQRCDKGEILVSSDAVFSMDGDAVNIRQWLDSAQQKNAWCMLDDAHGFGVLGNQGRGSLSEQQIDSSQLHIYMATLGKAIGTSGAFIAASEDLIEYLIQTARSYIYTTAMPPATAQASLSSLKLLIEEPHRQQSLRDNITLFKQLSLQAGLPVMPSDSAIQPVMIGPADKALAISQQLFTKGLHIAAIRPPTVPKNTARLRITLRADHTSSDLQQLVEQLHSLLKQ